jgi:hypothetical protein
MVAGEKTLTVRTVENAGIRGLGIAGNIALSALQDTPATSQTPDVFDVHFGDTKQDEETTRYLVRSIVSLATGGAPPPEPAHWQAMREERARERAEEATQNAASAAQREWERRISETGASFSE